jgi:hypothetical protein
MLIHIRQHGVIGVMFIFGLFLALQDKRNRRTLSVNIELVYTRSETDQRFAFLPISKTHTNKINFSRQCTYIVYIHNTNYTMLSYVY